MTDITVVNLCRQYLDAKANDRLKPDIVALLQLICDRLEEIGADPVEHPSRHGTKLSLDELRSYLSIGLFYSVTVPRILKEYGG